MSKHCIFQYCYRDGGNWKTYGELLLIGDPEGVVEPLRECLEWSDLFVAEQVGVPSLCTKHFESCADGPSDLDHAYHEFVGLRVATRSEVERLRATGGLQELMGRFRAASRRWDVTLSPNCWL